MHVLEVLPPKMEQICQFSLCLEVLEFTPGADAPANKLYYQCTTHFNMGWKIFIVDSPVTTGKRIGTF